VAKKEPMEAWWGRHALAEGRRGLWRIGPLDLWLERSAGAIQLLTVVSRDVLEPTSRVQVPARRRLPDPATMDERLRFIGTGLGSDVAVVPALADRLVVSRPESPLRVPTGERATLYVSSPLWIRVQLDGGRLLHERPAYRLSDTWVGSSTRDGELAYASRTHGRLDWRGLSVTRHRAVTPVHIENRGDDTLLLERVNLPIPRLALYLGDEAAPLWTQPVHLERSEKSGLADVRLENGPPEEAGDAATELASPRQNGERHFVSRAFNALF
jgi:hypothetical protein